MLYETPLCPAGHLPLTGGDWMSHQLSLIFNLAQWAPRSKLPISPLEGEMAGRPEGGALARRLVSIA
ncbi:MAG: lytic murein transglycosylase [Mesorhizobium sp.]|nr:MAG: lytic murein transglycosylase [Mesorhizobium sp.]